MVVGWRDDVPLGFITDDHGNQGYGIDILGVPVGDNDYIDISMQCKAKEVVRSGSCSSSLRSRQVFA